MTNTVTARTSGIAYANSGSKTLETPIGTLKASAAVGGVYSISFTPSIDCVADIIYSSHYDKNVSLSVGVTYDDYPESDLENTTCNVYFLIY